MTLKVTHVNITSVTNTFCVCVAEGGTEPPVIQVNDILIRYVIKESVLKRAAMFSNL